MDLVAGWSAWRAIGLLCCLHFVTFLHSGAINRLARCHGGYSFLLLVALGSGLQHATAGGVVLTLVRFFLGKRNTLVPILSMAFGQRSLYWRSRSSRQDGISPSIPLVVLLTVCSSLPSDSWSLFS